MTCAKWLILPVLLVGMLSMKAVAQEGGRDDGPPGPGGRMGGGGREGGPGMERGGRLGGGRGMQQGPPLGGRLGGRESMDERRPGGSGGQVEMVRGYLELVDRFSRLTGDPATSGIAAVIQAAEVLRPRGADAAIEYFTKVLPDTKNEAVQRAIRIQLIELYKNSGQQDKALSELRGLITSAPAGGTATPAR